MASTSSIRAASVRSYPPFFLPPSTPSPSPPTPSPPTEAGARATFERGVPPTRGGIVDADVESIASTSTCASTSPSTLPKSDSGDYAVPAPAPAFVTGGCSTNTNALPSLGSDGGDGGGNGQCRSTLRATAASPLSSSPEGRGAPGAASLTSRAGGGGGAAAAAAHDGRRGEQMPRGRKGRQQQQKRQRQQPEVVPEANSPGKVMMKQ